MQFKAELIEQILAGKKTQTRRPVKPGEKHVGYAPGTHYAHCVIKTGPDRLKWQVGKTYAVCPGRGKAAVARIKLLNIRREDVRNISDEDAIAEGFPNRMAQFWFWKTWCEFYDKPGWKLFSRYNDHDALLSRPAHLYDAWVLEFELVK